jgi:hypothetical protein
MKTRTNLHILGATLLFASAVALAGEEIKDSTEFQVRTASGQVEKVSVENLAVGEVRTVTSERGTTVVVGRHERGYVLDVAGERIEVDTPAVQGLTTDEEVVINHDGGHDKQIVIKLGDHDKLGNAAAHQQRRVVVMRPEGSEGKTIRIEEGEGADKLVHEMDLNDPELGDKRVMVVRKVEKRVTEGQQ